MCQSSMLVVRFIANDMLPCNDEMKISVPYIECDIGSIGLSFNFVFETLALYSIMTSSTHLVTMANASSVSSSLISGICQCSR